MSENNEYLGDGVYASFDGYQVWLAVNHHENLQVAIEPKVMRQLFAYASRVWGNEVPLTDEERHQINASNQHQERDE
jgi:hypothetical protein